MNFIGELRKGLSIATKMGIVGCAVVFFWRVTGSCNIHASETAQECVITDYSGHASCNSIYWWKTTYDPDSLELAFLRQHHIGRMYVRYFDVVYDPALRPESIVPNATLQFKQELPDSMEIVPTVFITNEAMANWPDEISRDSYYSYSYEEESPYYRTPDNYIDQLVYRIKAMNQRNHVNNVREVQVDCDWSGRTRENFYRFCEKLRSRLHEEGIALSSTIRMHQLRQDPPPVDRGVLMCYNTGALRTLSTSNSILDASDVYRYMKGTDLKHYNLPLDVAYPTFGWSVLYDANDTFLGLVRTTDLSDDTCYEPIGNDRYRVKRDCNAGHALLHTGNILRREESSIATVQAVKKQIDLKRNIHDPEYSTILYHLDSDNLSKYSYDEIQSLYQ